MYSDLKPLIVGDALDLHGTSASALYTLVLPTGHREIVVRAITTTVTTQINSSQAAGVLLYNGSTLVKTCSTVAKNAAVGVTNYDEVADGTSGQRFKAGDSLIVKNGTKADTAGKVQVILWID
jgi:hypothetical protein